MAGSHPEPEHSSGEMDTEMDPDAEKEALARLDEDVSSTASSTSGSNSNNKTHDRTPGPIASKNHDTPQENMSEQENSHHHASSDSDDEIDPHDPRPRREHPQEETEDDIPNDANPINPVTTNITLPPQSLRRLSAFTQTACVIPRSERRGLFASLAIIPEVNTPWGYKNKTKWTVTLIVALAAAAAPMGSGIFYPALPQLTIDLNTTPTTANLTVAMYMLAMAIFPLWWSSFSETLGRRTIYIISFSLFVIFSVVSALSVNIAMLIVMRILGGGASASVQAVGAGTIADLWEPAERGRAMGIFYLGPLVGPLIAPILGGALSEAFGWRATMYFLAIYGGVMLIMIIFCLPETLPRPPPPPPAVNLPEQDQSHPPLKRISTAASAKIKTKRAVAVLRRLFIEPLEVILYLRYPPVQVSVYSAAIAFGSLFIINISIQATFAHAPYSFPSLIVGLLYLPLSFGYITASLTGGPWIDYIMKRQAKKAGRFDDKGKLIFLPEDRMAENMWLAATLYPGAMIWYGWSSEKGLPWIVACIANFFFGCGSMLVFGTVTTMLTEFMPKKSSSGVAVNNFVRNIFSCVGSIVAQPLINAIGNGWLCTAVGLFAWVTGNLAIWMLRRKATAWRVSMDKALNKRE